VQYPDGDREELGPDEVANFAVTAERAAELLSPGVNQLGRVPTFKEVKPITAVTSSNCMGTVVTRHVASGGGMMMITGTKDNTRDRTYTGLTCDGRTATHPARMLWIVGVPLPDASLSVTATRVMAGSSRAALAVTFDDCPGILTRGTEGWTYSSLPNGAPGASTNIFTRSQIESSIWSRRLSWFNLT
jgi:hypothetical protein